MKPSSEKWAAAQPFHRRSEATHCSHIGRLAGYQVIQCILFEEKSLETKALSKERRLRGRQREQGYREVKGESLDDQLA